MPRQSITWIATYTALLICSAAVGYAASPATNYFNQDAKAEADALITQALKDPASGFKAWMARHNIAYASQQAQETAYTIWTAKVQHMAEHNAKPGMSFFMKMNDRTGTDPTGRYVGRMSGRRLRQDGQKFATGLTRPADAVQTSPLRSIGFRDEATTCPESLDWRDFEYVTPVKNQRDCGACWAFAAAGALESAFAIATNELPTLSEQELLDCTGGPNTCTNGILTLPLQYAIYTGGIATQEAYPYTGVPGDCRASQALNNPSGVVPVSYTELATNDEGALLNAVCNQPVAIAIAGGAAAFQSYGGGILEADGDDCSSSSPPDHAVIVIGYTPEYWIVKNSFGTAWGEDGYGRIRRGDNVCAIVSQPPVVPTVSGVNVPMAPTADVEEQQERYRPVYVDNLTFTERCDTSYTSEEGDSWADIAAKTKVNIQTLLSVRWFGNVKYRRTWGGVGRRRQLLQDIQSTRVPAGQQIKIPCIASQELGASLLQCKDKYIWKNRDTLKEVAARFNVSGGAQGLLNANHQFTNLDDIFEGDTVFIPPCVQTLKSVKLFEAREQCKEVCYTTREGDYLYKIANAFSCTVGDLLNLNPDLNRATTCAMRPGTEMYVLSCPVAARSYYTVPKNTKTICEAVVTVKPGDTLGDVSRRFNVSRANILKENDISEDLYVGQVLNIPPCSVIEE